MVFPNKGNFLTLWDPPDEYEQQYQADKTDHYPRQFGDEVIKPIGFDDFEEVIDFSSLAPTTPAEADFE